MKKLTEQQVQIIKDEFEKDSLKKLRVLQGNISTLMELSNKIGEGLDYSIISKNLKQLF